MNDKYRSKIEEELVHKDIVDLTFHVNDSHIFKDCDALQKPSFDELLQNTMKHVPQPDM